MNIPQANYTDFMYICAKSKRIITNCFNLELGFHVTDNPVLNP